MADIAAAAGISRQTLYSQYPNRASQLDALRAQLITPTTAVLDGELRSDPAAGLEEWLSRAWNLLHSYPALLNPVLFADPSETDVAAHEPVIGGLRRLLTAAADRDLLAPGVTPEWLIAAVIALGHAAGQEVGTGRMTSAAAGAAFRSSALRICLRAPRR